MSLRDDAAVAQLAIARKMAGVRIEIVGIAVAVALGSALIPLSYDEAYWLGIWGMWSDGAALYDTALDNKSPVVYLIFGLIQALPGSFQLGRAIIIGLLLVLLDHGVGEEGEGRSGESRLVTGLSIAVIPLLAGFTMRTELLAAPFALWSLVWGRQAKPLRAGMSAVAATCVTPLAVGLIPVALFLARRAPRDRYRRAVAITIGLAVAVGLGVALVENLRYGLIELNLVSRQTLGSLTDAHPIAERVMLTALSLLPLGAIGTIRRWGRRTVGLLLVIAAPAILAGWFPHYWILPAVAAMALDDPGELRLSVSRRRLAFVALSVTPLLYWSVLQLGPHFQRAETYTEIVAALAPLDDEEWTFVPFDLQPDVATAYPSRVALRSPSINYLIWQTSRSPTHRAELAEVLRSADVLLEPGLDDPQIAIPENVAHLVPVIRSAIGGFDCSMKVEHMWIHLRQRFCTELSL